MALEFSSDLVLGAVCGLVLRTVGVSCFLIMFMSVTAAAAVSVVLGICCYLESQNLKLTVEARKS